MLLFKGVLELITVVSLNPCIDKTVIIENFAVDKLNRITSWRQDPSGKGVNVALDVQALGVQAACIGFLWMNNGGIIEQRLKDAGVVTDFVYMPGDVRVNIKVVDPVCHTYTEINDRGCMIDTDALSSMERKIEEYTAKSSIMVFTGSIPPGVPHDIYGRWIKAVSAHGVKAILDADGSALAYGIDAVPYMIKPNIHELQRYLQRSLDGVDELKAAVEQLMGKGIDIVLVSMGAEGAFIGFNDKGAHTFYRAPAVPVEVKSTTGAGDAMVSAMAVGLERGQNLCDMFSAAMAAAAAAVMAEGTQPISRETVEGILNKVHIFAI